MGHTSGASVYPNMGGMLGESCKCDYDVVIRNRKKDSHWKAAIPVAIGHITSPTHGETMLSLMAEVAELKRKYQLLEAQVHLNQSIGSIGSNDRSNHHHHHHHHHHQQLNRSCRFGSHFNNHCNNEMRERFGHKRAVDIENDAEPDEESRLGDELSVGTNSTGS